MAKQHRSIFRPGLILAAVVAGGPASAAPTRLVDQPPVSIAQVAPGWKQASIQPEPGRLTSASGKAPTPLGPVQIGWRRAAAFTLSLSLPPGMTASVALPAAANSTGVFTEGWKLPARRAGSRWMLDRPVSGNVTLKVE